MKILKQEHYDKLNLLSDKYGLFWYEIENTAETVDVFIDKMRWLYENTCQVSVEDWEWVSTLIEQNNT